MLMNAKVDDFINRNERWQDEMKHLRKIALDCGITEDFKWKHPCYTFQGSNIFLIHGFKDYCALLFHKGALLKDTNNLLIQQTENVQSARQIRFTNLNEIIENEAVLKTYIFEAIEVEKAGLKVKMKEPKDIKMPDEFKKRLDDNSDLKSAFDALTPGRQRGYLLYFSLAKQSKTRESRIEKHFQRILNGKGLRD